MGFEVRSSTVDVSSIGVLAVAAALFFMLTGSVALGFEYLGYPSPDEQVAATFMKRVRDGLPLPIPEQLSETLENILHPRSTTVVNSTIVPQGFPLQMVLWGTLSRITHLPYPLFTPLLGALALPLLFPLFQLSFSSRVAFFVALLSMVHPAVLYYTSRGLYSNAPQLFLLIIALYFFTRNTRGRWLFGGALLGVAVALRPSELIWIAPMLLVFAWWSSGSLSRANVSLAFLAFSLIGFGVLLYQRNLYGGALLGYSFSSAASVIVGDSWSLEAVRKHAQAYLLSLLWWWTIPAVGGAFLFLRTPRDRQAPRRRYAILAFLVTAVLLLFYGSWNLRDTVSEEGITIGTSFVRYWLPIFILTLPLTAVGLISLQLPRVVVSFFVFVSLLYPTVWGFESLAHNLKQARANQTILKRAKQRLPPDAVLLVERSDKIFWPEYRVISGETEQQKVRLILPKVLGRAPLYFHRSSELAFGSFWNEEHLAKVGLRFGPAIQLDALNELLPIQPL